MHSLIFLISIASLCAANAFAQTNLSSAQNATEFALIYSIPIRAYITLVDTVKELTNASDISNIYQHQEILADSSYTAIVRPNSDTLYSLFLIDLSSQDIVLTIPDMGDRFYVFPFYDFYGNNFANFGKIDNTMPGDYLVRFNAQSPGLQPGDDTYAGYVNVPTVYGSIDLRIVVQNTSDVTNVVALQDQFAVATVDRTSQLPFDAPHLTPELFTANLTGSDIEKLLQLAARLTPFNPTEIPSDVSYVDSMLCSAGLQNGTYTTPEGVNLTAASIAANATITAWYAPPNTVPLGNNWSTLEESVCGDFKSDYTARAFVSLTGYLQLQEYESLYVTYTGTECGAHSEALADGKACMLKFSAEPEVTGFWSVTVYNDAGFLVPNDLSRYSLGDRSNLTLASDGSFQLLLQATDAAPPTNWTSNWIPTPPNNVFNFLIRLYGPSDALTNGSYVFPIVQAVDNVLA